MTLIDVTIETIENGSVNTIFSADEGDHFNADINQLDETLSYAEISIYSEDNDAPDVQFDNPRFKAALLTALRHNYRDLATLLKSAQSESSDQFSFSI